jgi:hypothetical protein
MQELVAISSWYEFGNKPNDIPTRCILPFSRCTSYCKDLRDLERHVALFAAHAYDTWSLYHQSNEAAVTRDQAFLTQDERSHSDVDFASRYRELSSSARSYVCIRYASSR